LRKVRKELGGKFGPDFGKRVLGDELEEPEPPVVEPRLFIAWQAFDELSRQRQISMAGAGPISNAEIFQYLDEILPLPEREDRVHFVRLIQVLDDEFLRLAHEKSKLPRVPKHLSKGRRVHAA
jgi:hypothetical protein